MKTNDMNAAEPSQLDFDFMWGSQKFSLSHKGGGTVIVVLNEKGEDVFRISTKILEDRTVSPAFARTLTDVYFAGRRDGHIEGESFARDTVWVALEDAIGKPESDE